LQVKLKQDRNNRHTDQPARDEVGTEREEIEELEPAVLVVIYGTHTNEVYIQT
jgi:hypothetical protein